MPNPIQRFLVKVLFSAAVIGGTQAGIANAAEITVNVNMARILRISAPASTVIVGNPAVADVTIQDPQTLILTGYSFGTTNLIVLDSAGNPIADSIVQVVRAPGDTVTVYFGDKRQSYSCAPECEPQILVGDHPDFTSQSVASTNLVAGAINQ